MDNGSRNKNFPNGKIRHRAEKVMVVLAVVYIIFIVLVALFLLAGSAAGMMELDSDMTNSLCTVAFLLGLTFTRAQEYSADRAAASVCRQGHYAENMAALFVGKYQSKYVDVEAFCEEDAKEKSLFWLKLVNFISDHPVARRRLEALSRMDKEGWEGVHGKML